MLNQTNAMNTETWLENLIGKNTENKNIKTLFLMQKPENLKMSKKPKSN